jgi:hypothetical protein
VAPDERNAANLWLTIEIGPQPCDQISSPVAANDASILGQEMHTLNFNDLEWQTVL